jgi:hypothetical protein
MNSKPRIVHKKPNQFALPFHTGLRKNTLDLRAHSIVTDAHYVCYFSWCMTVTQEQRDTTLCRRKPEECAQGILSGSPSLGRIDDEGDGPYWLSHAEIESG